MSPFNPVPCLSLLGLLAITASASAAVPPAAPGTEGRVTSVTLYRGEALVTRTVPVEGPANQGARRRRPAGANRAR